MSSVRQGEKSIRKFHRDGTLWARGKTLHGKATGYWQWFRMDGTRLRSGYFAAGRQVGKWTTYDRHGAVYKVTQMRPESERQPSGARSAKSGAAPGVKPAAAKTPSEYLAMLPADRKTVIRRLREVLRKNLPKGFEEAMEYGMISYMVPLSLYPQGYLRDPSRPLPFIALASQKQYVSLYHMGLYAGPLLTWFKAAWQRHTAARCDLGKVCLRLRNLEDIPYGLIGELASRVTPSEWIETYQAALEKRRPSWPRRDS